MSNLHNVSGDGKNIRVVFEQEQQGVIGNRNVVDARVNSPDENVIGAYARIHGDPIVGHYSGNIGNTPMNNSIVGNTPMNNSIRGNTPMNKSPPHVKGDDNKLDYRFNAGDRNVIRDHVEIIGSPIIGHYSGNNSKIDDESNDRNKKGGGTTGR